MNNTKIPVITLDGPSGTGKGTLCQLLADHLKWHMLDSGAIYRVLAHAAHSKGLTLEDQQPLIDLALSLDLCFKTADHAEPEVFLDNQIVTQAIRTEQCGQNASKIAAIPAVRKALLQRQRDFAQPPGLVTDGRDMGTIVFPDAVLKLFVYANEHERANRRYLQLKKKKINVSLAQVVEELAIRDARDRDRAFAPMKPAEDAILVDTTGLTIVQVFDNVLKLIDKRLI